MRAGTFGAEPAWKLPFNFFNWICQPGRSSSREFIARLYAAEWRHNERWEVARAKERDRFCEFPPSPLCSCSPGVQPDDDIDFTAARHRSRRPQFYQLSWNIEKDGS